MKRETWAAIGAGAAAALAGAGGAWAARAVRRRAQASALTKISLQASERRRIIAPSQADPDRLRAAHQSVLAVQRELGIAAGRRLAVDAVPGAPQGVDVGGRVVALYETGARFYEPGGVDEAWCGDQGRRGFALVACVADRERQRAHARRRQMSEDLAVVLGVALMYPYAKGHAISAVPGGEQYLYPIVYDEPLLYVPTANYAARIYTLPGVGPRYEFTGRLATFDGVRDDRNVVIRQPWFFNPSAGGAQDLIPTTMLVPLPWAPSSSSRWVDPQAVQPYWFWRTTVENLVPNLAAHIVSPACGGEDGLRLAVNDFLDTMVQPVWDVLDEHVQRGAAQVGRNVINSLRLVVHAYGRAADCPPPDPPESSGFFEDFSWGRVALLATQVLLAGATGGVSGALAAAATTARQTLAQTAMGAIVNVPAAGQAREAFGLMQSLYQAAGVTLDPEEAAEFAIGDAVRTVTGYDGGSLTVDGPSGTWFSIGADGGMRAGYEDVEVALPT